MNQYIYMGYPEARPVGLFDSIARVGAKLLPKVTRGAVSDVGRVATREILGAGSGAGKSVSTILKTSGKWVEPTPITRLVPEIVHSGQVAGAKIPEIIRPVSTPDVFRAGLKDIHLASFKEAQTSFQKAFTSPAVELHPKLVGLSDDAALKVLRDRAATIADRPILVSPEAIAKSDTLLRQPEIAARLQGTSQASKNLSETLLEAISAEGRSLTQAERSSLSAAMRDMDTALVRFEQSPSFSPATLAKRMQSETEIALRKLEDPVGAALRHAEDPASSLLRRGEDYGTVLGREAFESVRPGLAGETGAIDRFVIDEAGRPLVQRSIMSGDRATYTVYRELTETELRSLGRGATDAVGDVGRSVARDLPEAEMRSLGRGAAEAAGGATRSLTSDLAGGAARGASVYRTLAVAGGAAVVGGVAAKLLLSPAEAIPLGSDLDAYRQMVCDPESQYYDEASCQMVTDILRLIQTYPGSWEDVCVVGSPIYDPQACRAIQGMVAAAEKGVPYQGGDAEDYDGKTEIVDQNKIDELISMYCHPASSAYDPEMCARVKETAARYGFSVTDPGGGHDGGTGGGGSAGGGDGALAADPPWDDLTLEEIHAIVCDKYGQWYDPVVCKDYTDYLYSQRDARGDGDDDLHRGDDAEKRVIEQTDDGLYVSGRPDYAMYGGYFDGGWYGGGGGGAIYYDTPPGTEPMCHLEDITCIGWFEYVSEWFYWDGRNFYDTSGNLVYFVWTEEDQAEYEQLLLETSPLGY